MSSPLRRGSFGGISTGRGRAGLCERGGGAPGGRRGGTRRSKNQATRPPARSKGMRTISIHQGMPVSSSGLSKKGTGIGVGVVVGVGVAVGVGVRVGVAVGVSVEVGTGVNVGVVVGVGVGTTSVSAGRTENVRSCLSQNRYVTVSPASARCEP